VELFAQALIAAGTQPVFATLPPEGPFHIQMSQLGLKAYGLGVRSGATYPAACLRLARIARAERAQIIHAVESLPAGVSALATSISTNLACVYHRQHSKIDWPRTAFNFVASRRCDLVIACSQASADNAIRVDNVPQSRIRMVYNGAPELREVSYSELTDLRTRLNIPPTAYVLASVARLRKEKGIQSAIAALPHLARQLDRPVHYVSAGEGPYAASLKMAAKSSGQIHFVGHQRDVAPWYRLADLVLMPSFNEALPSAALEAMGCSRPIVASRVGGLTEVVLDGATGVLVPADDPAGLSAAIAQLLVDRQRRHHMGAAGHQRFKDLFTLEAMVSGLLACWREVARAELR
jgi:glycosyltransferase involved in cell wall biosynthesis